MTKNTNSILLSVKKNLGLMPDQTEFDSDLILLINGVFVELNQLGVGPEDVFSITDDDYLWSDFSNETYVNLVKAYMFLEVKLMFDPPAASVLSALERKRDEYEWRLNIAADGLSEEVEDE